MKPNTPFKWVFIDTIPSIYSKILTKDTTFSNLLLIVDAYYKLTKLYRMKNITTEELMDKIYTFQSKLGKVDIFGW